MIADTGALAFDADANNAANGGCDDRLDVAANITLTSATSLTLDATTGGVSFAGAGTLNADNGVTINNAVTATAGTLTIDSDVDNNGAGTFTTAALGTINAAGQTFDLTAADAVIGAGISATTINITDSDGGGIGLGATGVSLDISGAELQLLTSTATTELITAGGITVDNITAGNSNNINSLTLDATGVINFSNNASTFNALTVESDSDINVNVNVTTDTGVLAFDADTNNAVMVVLMIVWILPLVEPLLRQRVLPLMQQLARLFLLVPAT